MFTQPASSFGRTVRKMSTRSRMSPRRRTMVTRMRTMVGFTSKSIRDTEADPIPENTGKGSMNIGSSDLIRRELGLVEKELVLVGRVVDLKSTIGLMLLGLAFMSMLLLLFRRRSFGETVQKRRKKRLAS